jgi:hypothetical protein
MVVENIEEEKSNNIKNEIYMVMNYYEWNDDTFED